MTIKVIGHKAPDSDTICSSIAYAWLLKQEGKKAQAHKLGNLNKETIFILDKFNVTVPKSLESLNKEDEVVIVDTNNKDELPEGLLDSKIISIIDHHKLVGNINTDHPIAVIIKPWASTASIIWKHIKHKDYKIDKNIAGILLAAIVSDTLKFTSPSTTQKDKEAAQELAKIVGVNIDQLAKEMFEAKSDLSGMSVTDILLVDSKVFEFGKSKTRLSVLETTSPENALSMIKELREASENLKKKENLDYLFFFVVDILNSGCVLVSGNKQEIKLAQKAFGGKFVGEILQLKGIVSRKKQIIPALEPEIESIS